MFAFRLALQCGYPHPRIMMEHMTGEEYAEAREYADIEPYGQYREELRHGQKMAQYANYHRDPKACPEGFPAIDYMNFTERPKEKQLTEEEIETALSGIFGA